MLVQFGIYLVIMYFVVDDAQAGIQELGGPGLVALVFFQGVDNQFPFKVFDSRGQGQWLVRTHGTRTLQCRRHVDGLDCFFILGKVHVQP